MADIKWIKITTNMFDDEKLKLIDCMPERDTIHYIWIRLLVQCGKTNANGYIFLNENVPYTEEMLSTIFNRPINSIRLALKTLSDFGMIHVQEDKVIQIINWTKHQNIEGMDKVREQTRKRVAEYRAKKKELKEANDKGYEAPVTQNVTVTESNVTVTPQRERKKEEEEIEIEQEVDIKKREKEDLSISKIEEQSFKLVQYYEVMTGQIGILNPGAIKIVIMQHGYDNVKMAMDYALGRNKTSMNYIGGILKNWRIEGYPRKDEGIDGFRNNCKKNRADEDGFVGKSFIPKQPKQLTADELERVKDDIL